MTWMRLHRTDPDCTAIPKSGHPLTTDPFTCVLALSVRLLVSLRILLGRIHFIFITLPCHVPTAFGVGSMIYSGLEFAQYFEIDVEGPCHNLLMALTPAARMTFTFIQMYFIFLNAKVKRKSRLLQTIARLTSIGSHKQMTITAPKAVAYFGLMHMVATNLCVWLNVIVEETKHEILQFHHNGTGRKSVNLSTNGCFRLRWLIPLTCLQTVTELLPHLCPNHRQLITNTTSLTQKLWSIPTRSFKAVTAYSPAPC